MPVEIITKAEVKENITQWNQLVNREVYRIISGHNNTQGFLNQIAIYLSMDSARGVLYVPNAPTNLVNILSIDFFRDYRLILEHLPNYKVQVVLE